jgi:hypothetical protein
MTRPTTQAVPLKLKSKTLLALEIARRSLAAADLNAASAGANGSLARAQFWLEHGHAMTRLAEVELAFALNIEEDVNP